MLQTTDMSKYNLEHIVYRWRPFVTATLRADQTVGWVLMEDKEAIYLTHQAIMPEGFELDENYCTRVQHIDVISRRVIEPSKGN